MASGVIDIKQIGYDGLFTGKPSTVNTYQTVSLGTGKKFSDYTTLMFILFFYGNAQATVVIPTGIFKTFTSSGQRLMIYAGESTPTAQMYYVSDTAMALNMTEVTARSVAVYGMLV